MHSWTAHQTASTASTVAAWAGAAPSVKTQAALRITEWYAAAERHAGKAAGRPKPDSEFRQRSSCCGSAGGRRAKPRSKHNTTTWTAVVSLKTSSVLLICRCIPPRLIDLAEMGNLLDLLLELGELL